MFDHEEGSSFWGTYIKPGGLPDELRDRLLRGEHFSLPFFAADRLGDRLLERLLRGGALLLGDLFAGTFLSRDSLKLGLNDAKSALQVIDKHCILVTRQGNLCRSLTQVENITLNDPLKQESSFVAHLNVEDMFLEKFTDKAIDRQGREVSIGCVFSKLAK